MCERKTWTEDEEIYLEYYLFGDAAGDERETNYDAAADFLGIPNKKIMGKARKMRAKNKNVGHVRKPFTEREIEYLRRSYGVQPSKDIAETLGRLQGTVINKANSLGLTKRKKISDFDKEIRKLAKEGYWRAEIARFLGLKKSSVVAYINRNGIKCDNAPKEITQQAWREDEEIRYHNIRKKTYLE